MVKNELAEADQNLRKVKLIVVWLFHLGNASLVKLSPLPLPLGSDKEASGGLAEKSVRKES